MFQLETPREGETRILSKGYLIIFRSNVLVLKFPTVKFRGYAKKVPMPFSPPGFEERTSKKVPMLFSPPGFEERRSKRYGLP
jgi:hypothetical protein